MSNSPTLIEQAKNHWPQVLWGALLVAFSVNLLYLLWPQQPETLVIHPHPATLRAEAQTDRVLVESPSEGYLLLETTVTADHQTRSSKKPVRPRQSVAKSKAAFTGKVNINTASMAQLQVLPGIGPKMAERIVNYRKQHGPFQATQQLMDVEGIGPKKLEKLASHLNF